MDGWIDGWMDDAILRPFQRYFIPSYQIDGPVIIKGFVVQWDLFAIERCSLKAELKPGAARTADQRLIY